MKQPFLYTVICLAIGLFTFVSCTEDEGNVETLQATDYYPLNIGNYIEYKLDSTIFSDFDNSVKTNNYFVKNEITGSIIDGEGDTLYEVKRYIKPADDSKDYEFQYVHYVKETLGRLETIENQLRFVKLISPIIAEKTWAGNEFITTTSGDNPNTATFYYDNWEYNYVSINEPLALTNVSVENALHVNQVDRVGGAGAINHFVANEYYAKGIGLVKKRMEMVVENCGSANCSEKELPILERTRGRKGYIVDMEMIDFSVN